MGSVVMWATIAISGLLFLRYSTVYKDDNKINYSPIVLGISVVGSLFHIILASSIETNTIKEAILIFVIGVILYIIMGVMNQTAMLYNQSSTNKKIDKLYDEVEIILNNMKSFRSRLDLVTELESSTLEQIRRTIKEDLESFNNIQTNQKSMSMKLESIIANHQLLAKQIEEFVKSDMPGIDSVLHRHIEMLRNQSNDHFIQVKNAFQSSQEEQGEMKLHIKELHNRFSKDHTIAILQRELNKIVNEFALHIKTIGIRSESIVTKLLQHDEIIKDSTIKSETLSNNINASSQELYKMLHQAKSMLDEFRAVMISLKSIDELKDNFDSSRGDLEELIHILRSQSTSEFHIIRSTLEEVSLEATTKLRELVEFIKSKELHKETATKAEVKNLQDLTSKVKFQKSYGSDSE